MLSSPAPGAVRFVLIPIAAAILDSDSEKRCLVPLTPAWAPDALLGAEFSNSGDTSNRGRALVMSENLIGALGLEGAKPMLGGVLPNANGALLVLAPFRVGKSLLLRAFEKRGSKITFGNASSPFSCVATPTRFLSDGLKQIAIVAIARALSFGGPSSLMGSSLKTGRDGAKLGTQGTPSCAISKPRDLCFEAERIG